MTSTVKTAVDAGGYPIEQCRDFIRQGREAATLALEPSRALLDASHARGIAVQLFEDFMRAGVLFEDVLAERARFERDGTTRHDVLRERWDSYEAEAGGQARTLAREIVTRIDELLVALHDEALPVNPDPSALLVARQEIELAIRLEPSFVTLAGMAARGGDIAAAAASPWGRLTLINASGDDAGFETVQSAAITAALAGEDEGRRRAAAALQATRTPRQGQRVRSLGEASTFLCGFILDLVVPETLKRGFVPERGL